MAIRLKVKCRPSRKPESFVAALARELAQIGRDTDEAIVRVLAGEATEADRLVFERAEKAAKFLLGAVPS